MDTTYDKVIAVTGSRHCNDDHYDIIKDNLIAATHESGNIKLVHGGARGADSIACSIAISIGWDVEEYTPDWGRYGRGAGIIRNYVMLKESSPDEVIGFIVRGRACKGTRDCLKKAKSLHLPTTTVYLNE